MVRRRAALLLMTLGGAVALPVVTPVSAQAVPVAPTVHRLVLTGVDTASLAASPAALDPAAVRTSTGTGGAATVTARVASTTRPTVFTRQMATGRFTAAGLSWSAAGAPSGVVAQLRMRESGRWSDWQVLDLAAGPDPTSGEGRNAAGVISTEPISSGSADAVQVRVDSARSVAPSGLTLITVDPGVSPADAAVAGAAPAAILQPSIITRAQWGADESLLNLHGPCPGYSSTVKVGFVHHTVGSNSYAPSESAGIVRGIYAYHVMGNGWCDIGYNFLVDRYGQIFEGRHGGVDKAVTGAHTLAFNTDSFGVAAMGTFSTDTPPSAMTTAISAVLGWKLSLFGADPQGKNVLISGGGTGAKYPAGTPVQFFVVSGHRDGYATECPGQVLYNDLPSLRVQAAAYIDSHEIGSTVVPSILPAGAVVTSPNGRFRLIMQGDGNLVTYASGQATWSTGTFFPHTVLRVQSDGNAVLYGTSDGLPLWSPLVTSPGGRLEIQNDGNLVLYSAGGTPLWASQGSVGRPATTWQPQRLVTRLEPSAAATSDNELYRLVMQADGNLVLYRASGQPLWWTGILRSGSSLVVQSDGNSVVYAPGPVAAWDTALYSPGARMLLQNDGNVVVYSAGGVALWDSAGYVGHRAVRLL